MSGGLFSRLKVWIYQDTVASADLNGEFDNIIAHMMPIYVDNYSHSVGEMQTQRNPGTVGGEILASSTADELASLRYMIAQAMGTPYWYSTPPSSLTALAALAGSTGSNQNKILSGANTGGQPMFFVPASSGYVCTLSASAGSPFVYMVNGTQYTLTANVTINLSSQATGGTFTTGTVTGSPNQYDEIVDVTSTPFSGFEGTYQTFSMVNSSTEYFRGYVKASGAEIDTCFRGMMFGNSGSQFAAVVPTGTVTRLITGIIFLSSTGTLACTQKPIQAFYNAPSTAAYDYYLNLQTGQWMVVSAGNWVVANALPIAFTAISSTGCLAARSFDFSGAFSDLNTIVPSQDIINTTQIVSQKKGNSISVYGNVFSFPDQRILWDTSVTGTWEAGTVPSTDVTAFMYIDNQGTPWFSLVRPTDRRTDLRGFYHPAKPWRCIGFQLMDSSAPNFPTGLDGKNSFTSPYTYGTSYPPLILENEISQLTLSSGNISGNVSATAFSQTLRVRSRKSGTFLVFVVPSALAKNGSGSTATSVTTYFTYATAAAGTLESLMCFAQSNNVAGATSGIVGVGANMPLVNGGSASGLVPGSYYTGGNAVFLVTAALGEVITFGGTYAVSGQTGTAANSVAGAQLVIWEL